jgi:transcription initiation factor TFIIB
MGEHVCSNCGIVFEGSIADYDVKLETNQSDTCYKETDFIHNSIGSSTSINKLNVDFNGGTIPLEQVYSINRMRRMDKLSFGDRNFERNLRHANNALRMLKDRSFFNEALIEIAFNRYIKTLRGNLIKGRSIKGFIAAALYSACRELNVPRTLDEISDSVNVNRILTRKCYNLLVHQLNLIPPTVESNVYLTRVANNASISKKTLLKAIDIWSKIKGNQSIQGKKPLALSMALLYYASTLTGEKITQTNLAKSCNMSKVTLSKRLAEVKEMMRPIV